MGEVEAQATHVVPHGQTCYDAPRFAAAINTATHKSLVIGVFNAN